MQTRPLQKRDYDLIVQVIDRWWGGPTSALAHPIFFYELGTMARIVEDEGIMVGFLLGFIARSSSSGDVGYVHLVGIHPDHRRRGVGRLLYMTFEEDCKNAGVVRMKAITTLGNEGSQRFHQALGWDMCEIEDYAGPGRPRIVFTKEFPGAPQGPEAKTK
jgi:GNAT superfamily N-acetyltransferase